MVPFPFEKYPAHVRVLKAYCWKPLIIKVLIDFSLTVKAATLIFIFGCGFGYFICYLKFGEEIISYLGRANVRAFHENPNRIHTERTFVNP